ncbi:MULTISPECIES: hypothetical protein [Paracoccus]|nr:MULTISPECIES: hypothetical protein [Paracoccus]
MVRNSFRAIEPGGPERRSADMRQAAAPLLLIATLAFIASTFGYALRPVALALEPATEFGMGMVFESENVFLDLGGQFLQPRVLTMMGLLVVTWLALGFHAIRCLLTDEGGRHDEYALLIVGLIAGATWPWLRDGHPMMGIMLCAVMLAGFLGAALSAMRLGDRIRNSGALGFAAGWATLVTCAYFATLLQTQLRAPMVLAAGIAILIAALAAVNVQLRLGGTISYSVAVIWGMIGLAAGSVSVEAALATMAVLAIAVIAVALVRVTT